jgi:hypothetical protein
VTPRSVMGVNSRDCCILVGGSGRVGAIRSHHTAFAQPLSFLGRDAAQCAENIIGVFA